ncbi:hypothetical protein EI555_015919 [Monodon monoceros]|uniref:Olduvai domain-containing protein n=1 Tax=Monodon monoceros TaxID=40151 RepID=A0A4U1F448_MONMO|nr:hypothetical protein EI555_015919 [Monodon monoceros]
MVNQPQARNSGPQSEFNLPGSTKHLRSQLAQCRQRYQDLQEKLLISEATVFAQANQLEKYRVMFTQLPKTGTEGKLAEELRSASWPGKYDSLIQDQARELSYLRQKIREGRGICYLLTQHAKDTVKSFEDLLRSNDIDYYLGQSFREQLAQGSQLTERLTSKLSTRLASPVTLGSAVVLLHPTRLSRELQEKEKVIEVLQATLDARSLTPSSSRALSDSHRSPSSSSFSSDEPEACSDMDIASEYTHYEEKKASPSHSGFSISHLLLPCWVTAGTDLLEEHLGEIRNLRQRLEESICINDRLREQLEHRLSSTARGSGPTSNFYSPGLESTPQLCNENRVLREENQRLQAQLSHASRGGMEADLSSAVAAFSAALTPPPLPTALTPRISNQRAEGKDMEEAETREPW